MIARLDKRGKLCLSVLAGIAMAIIVIAAYSLYQPQVVEDCVTMTEPYRLRFDNGVVIEKDGDRLIIYGKTITVRCPSRTQSACRAVVEFQGPIEVEVKGVK